MSKLKPRIVVADDHEAMLKTVREIVTPHFEVVASVGDGEAALQETARTLPDLVLSDIAMPRLNGLQLARELKKRNLRCEIVFLTAHNDDDYVSEALRLGAKGYVIKQRLQPDLLIALNLAVAGKFFISPYAFHDRSRYGETEHVLHFYLDEGIFFEQVSEITCFALKRGEQVCVFLSKRGLRLLRERLYALGLDYEKAILRGQFHAFTVENVLPLLMDGTRPMSAGFDTFFSPLWRRAISHERVTIISDLLAIILEQGYGDRIAACIEGIWDHLIPKHSCTVYCGCPVTCLSSEENREALSAICNGQRDVIAIDKWRAGHHLIPIASPS